MSWASLLGGMALANSGLGAVHGFAAPIGGMFDAPHGAVCAAVLPHVIRVNVRAAAASGAEPVIRRYETVARMCTGRADATAEDGVRWIAELCRKLEIPGLRAYGVGPGDIPALVEKASQASSMKGNPVALSREELTEIVTGSL